MTVMKNHLVWGTKVLVLVGVMDPVVKIRNRTDKRISFLMELDGKVAGLGVCKIRAVEAEKVIKVRQGKIFKYMGRNQTWEIQVRVDGICSGLVIQPIHLINCHFIEFCYETVDGTVVLKAKGLRTREKSLRFLQYLRRTLGISSKRHREYRMLADMCGLEDIGEVRVKDEGMRDCVHSQISQADTDQSSSDSVFDSVSDSESASTLSTSSENSWQPQQAQFASLRTAQHAGSSRPIRPDDESKKKNGDLTKACMKGGKSSFGTRSKGDREYQMREEMYGLEDIGEARVKDEGMSEETVLLQSFSPVAVAEGIHDAATTFDIGNEVDGLTNEADAQTDTNISICTSCSNAIGGSCDINSLQRVTTMELSEDLKNYSATARLLGSRIASKRWLDYGRQKAMSFAVTTNKWIEFNL